MDDDFKARLAAALAHDTPLYYANGFVSVNGPSDMLIGFERNGKPNVSVNLSYTLAKTLHQQLGQMIADLENRTNRSFLTTQQVEEAIRTDKHD